MYSKVRMIFFVSRIQYQNIESIVKLDFLQNVGISRKNEQNIRARMHSSRMRTVRCSSRLLGGGGCLHRGGRPFPCEQNGKRL